MDWSADDQSQKSQWHICQKCYFWELDIGSVTSNKKPPRSSGLSVWRQDLLSCILQSKVNHCLHSALMCHCSSVIHMLAKFTQLLCWSERTVFLNLCGTKHIIQSDSIPTCAAMCCVSFLYCPCPNCWSSSH